MALVLNANHNFDLTAWFQDDDDIVIDPSHTLLNPPFVNDYAYGVESMDLAHVSSSYDQLMLPSLSADPIFENHISNEHALQTTVNPLPITPDDPFLTSDDTSLNSLQNSDSTFALSWDVTPLDTDPCLTLPFSLPLIENGPVAPEPEQSNALTLYREQGPLFATEAPPDDMLLLEIPLDQQDFILDEYEQSLGADALVITPRNHVYKCKNPQRFQPCQSRPYRCGRCEHGFRRAHDLRRHILTHTTNDKAFRWHCKVCGKSFTRIFAVERHHRRKHADLIYVSPDRPSAPPLHHECFEKLDSSSHRCTNVLIFFSVEG